LLCERSAPGEAKDATQRPPGDEAEKDGQGGAALSLNPLARSPKAPGRFLARSGSRGAGSGLLAHVFLDAGVEPRNGQHPVNAPQPNPHLPTLESRGRGGGSRRPYGTRPTPGESRAGRWAASSLPSPRSSRRRTSRLTTPTFRRRKKQCDTARPTDERSTCRPALTGLPGRCAVGHVHGLTMGCTRHELPSIPPRSGSRCPKPDALTPEQAACQPAQGLASARIPPV
jgi:hypothetical protein